LTQASATACSRGTGRHTSQLLQSITSLAPTSNTVNLLTLRNLVENALAHTPQHSEVSVSVLSDGSVKVADHGTGIAPEDRVRVFQRFWRGKGPATGGAGLGLAIVKEVANAHRASIRIEDNPAGQGAIFTLRFSPWVDAHRGVELVKALHT
jgi:K+-sensing histidine kinase KdpD